MNDTADRFLEALRRKGPTPHVVVAWGEEEYYKQAIETRLKKKILAEHPGEELNASSFCGAFDLNELREALNSSSFFGGLNWVVVEDPKLLEARKTDSRKDKKQVRSKAVQKGLLDFTELLFDVPDYSYVLCKCGKLDKRSAFYKSASQKAVTVECAPLKSYRLRPWLKEQAAQYGARFDAAAEVCYKIIAMVMKFAPYGVFALLLPVVCKNGPKVLLPLLSVILCVAIGCILQCIIVYSTLASVGGGVSPLKFFRGMSEAMMIAFTTCSSAAALPVNLKNCQEKLGLSREVSSFVLPLGCTINMDGTALYMGVCSLFIANVFGVNLTTNDMVMIVFTGTLASIGTAGVPGAGLIMLAMVLQAVQLPMEGLALVAGIDRVLDMFRTCVNITGDGAVACVVDKSERSRM